jgi:hypothetical protein
LLLDFSHAFPQHTPLVFNPSASLRQFGQIDHLGLIGVNQPGYFPVEGGELTLQAHPFLFRPDIHRGVATPLCILLPQHFGVSKQRLHMLPDIRLNHRGAEAAAHTRPRHIARVAQGADVPAALRTPRAHHAPATAPTDQQTPQQIQMLRVVALGPLAIVDELGLRPLPRLGIDERRHPDRNPFGVGTLRAALAIARATIFQPTQPIRPPEIPRLRAIVVGFPFVDGVP